MVETIEDDPREIARLLSEFADRLDHEPTDTVSVIGECLPGPLSVYGPVREWNLSAARDLLRRYRAMYVREFVKLWNAKPLAFRRAVAEEYEKLRLA